MLLFYLSLLDIEEEKSKLEMLYYEYKGLMLKIAYDILKDYDLANDALHNAFLKIINNLHKLEEKPCHKTKVYMVLVIESVSKNMYNSRKRRRSALVEFQDDSIIAENFENTVEQRLETEYIMKKIAFLSEQDRTVLTLRYVNDLSYKDIAKLMNIPSATARKRLERAKNRLQRLVIGENNAKE